MDSPRGLFYCVRLFMELYCGGAIHSGWNIDIASQVSLQSWLGKLVQNKTHGNFKIRTNLKNILNYKCRSLSNCATNKTVVGDFCLLGGTGTSEGLSMGYSCIATEHLFLIWTLSIFNLRHWIFRPFIYYFFFQGQGI